MEGKRKEESSDSGFVGFTGKQAKWCSSITRGQHESSGHQKNGIKGPERSTESGCGRDKGKKAFAKSCLDHPVSTGLFPLMALSPR